MRRGIGRRGNETGIAMSKQSILFVCTGNCCRSQIAEAMMRHLGGHVFEAASAGTHPAGYLHPLAEAALAEVGVGVEGLRSKSVDEVQGRTYDYVVTVCSEAESCSTLKGARQTLHWPVEDPAAYADQGQAGRVKARHVREILTDRILALIEASEKGTS